MAQSEKPVEKVIREACEAEGLPYGDPARSLEALLKHLSANHMLTVANWSEVAKQATERRADAWQDGHAAGWDDRHNQTNTPNPYCDKEA